MSSDFGSGWSCVTGLTFPSRMVTGNRIVGEAVARRWLIDRGTLIDDPNYGYNLLQFVNGELDTRALNDIAQNASTEAEKDERVLSCAVSCIFDGTTLTVSGIVRTQAGPFTLVLSVANLKVSLLQPAA